jgi:hypothetical protein
MEYKSKVAYRLATKIGNLMVLESIENYTVPEQ